MTPNSGRALELFTEAIQLPSEEQPAFLDRACGGDEALRRKIEALLKSNERAGSFLEQPPAAAFTEARAQTLAFGEKPGQWVDRYKLLQQIGEGGCGVVFLAEQEEPVRRRVALKVIKPGMDTKSVIARFEAERQALALMDHPGIAHVLDAGATESGRPYFVMELVEGPKITDYCDQHSLPIAARLDLFVKVCDAIQHAHQKGIIHRDIKPSNILMAKGADPEKPGMPKVIDFGIAKATTGQQLTDKTIFTAFEMLIGTPAYMSPEQAALTGTDVDTRTDIYSLGVLLYELLTGTTPFDTRELLKAGLDEVRRVIRDDQPVRPSTRLSTMLAADQVNVSNYHEADAPKLIREMRGDLDWIVMKALEKDRSRRYATANGFAMDVGRYLSGEAILARPPSTWYHLRKLASRNRILFGAVSMVAIMFAIAFLAVTVSFTRERTARRESEKSRQQAETDKTRSQQVTRFLEEMLDGVAPSVAVGRDTAMLREILNKTARRVDVELTNQPLVQADLRLRLGKVYSDLGQSAQAEVLFKQALATRTALLGEESEAASDVMLELGPLVSDSSSAAEGEACVRRALAVRQKLFGEKSLKVADCYEALGGIFFAHHQWKEAEDMLQRSLQIGRQILGDDGPALGDSRLGLGSIRFIQRRYPEAEALFRQAMTNWETILSADHPSITRCVNNLATVLAVQNKNDEAEVLLRHAVASRLKLYPEGHQSIVSSLGGLARVQMRLHKFDDAEVTCRQALAEARKVSGGTPQDVLEVLQDLTTALLEQHKPDQIDPVFAALLPPEGQFKPECASLLLARCEARARSGRWTHAASDATVLLAHDPDNHENFHTLAPLLVQLGNLAEYKRLCRTILAKFSGTTNPVVADRMAKDCLILPSSEVDAESTAALADEAVNHRSPPSTSPYFDFCKALGEFRIGHYEEAIRWAQLPAHGQYPNPKASATAVIAMSRFKLGQPDPARTSLSNCNAIIEKQLPRADQDLGTDWRDLIIAHSLRDEAEKLILSADGPAANPQPN
jgi:serine/threonine protein kinase